MAHSTKYSLRIVDLLMLFCDINEGYSSLKWNAEI